MYDAELMHDAEVLPCVRAAIVGRLGTAPLGAVGLSTLVFNFSNFLFSFLMTVTTPRVAVAAANGNRTEVCTRRHRAKLTTRMHVGCHCTHHDEGAQTRVT